MSWAGLQVDAKSVCVLSMLKQEPGAIERLLTRCANIAGRLIFT